jgi:hypothetical protein
MVNLCRIQRAGKLFVRVRYRCPESEISGIHDFSHDPAHDPQRVWLLQSPGVAVAMQVELEVREADGVNMRIACLVKLPANIIADASGIALLSTHPS